MRVFAKFRSRTAGAVLVVVLAGVIGVTVLTGGSEDEGRICTAKGGFTGVFLDEIGTESYEVAQERPSDFERLTLCADGRCASRRPANALNQFVSLELPLEVASTGRVPVVAVLERPRRVPQILSTVARLEREEVNGPGCGVDYNAYIVERGGRLVPLTRAERERRSG